MQHFYTYCACAENILEAEGKQSTACRSSLLPVSLSLPSGALRSGLWLSLPALPLSSPRVPLCPPPGSPSLLPVMSKIELLRLLITQRLTAAAEEIFGVFGRTIAEYEEEICRSKLEIDRQRRLLDLNRTPQIRLPGTSVLSEQQDPGDEDPPLVKEEAGEVYSDPHVAPPPDQNDVDFLLFHRKQDSEEPDPRPGQSDLSPDPLDLLEPPQLNGGPDGAPLEVLLSEAVDSYMCTLCGRSFMRRHHWTKHMQLHRKADAKVTKSYVCNICGRKLSRLDGYHKHLRIHTGEKPYACSHCGRRFSDNSNFKRHIRMHTLQTHATQPHDAQPHSQS